MQCQLPRRLLVLTCPDSVPGRYATELVVREERAMQLVQDMLLHQRDQSERNGVAAEARLAVRGRSNKLALQASQHTPSVGQHFGSSAISLVSCLNLIPYTNRNP